MPAPLQQFFDNNGAVLTSGGLCVFVAGTSTAASTYTTAALTIANTNPILFSNGRPTSGGVFLTPGASYKFELRDYAATVGTATCGAGVGSTIWTVDNVQAVPGSSAAVDITATAGESIAAGDAVYISDGTGSLTTGQIYRTDADFSYRSTSATMVGIAPNAITSGSTGTVRLTGAVTVAGPLSSGLPYYASGTVGAITATPPTNAIRLGTAVSSTSLIVGYTEAPVSPRGPPCGRLSLTTGVPVTTADVTGASAVTIFYIPYGGCNQINLYNGSNWVPYAFAQISIAVPATTATMYDVFAYDNAGVVALELTAWTNDTTRATALTFQDGVYVKTGALTRLYLGSFRTTAVSGQTEDSGFSCTTTKRYLWNYYNRVPRPLCRLESTASWTYTTATVRQANGAAANQVDVVVGVAEVTIDLTLNVVNTNSTGNIATTIGVGEDSTTTYIDGTLISGPSGSNPQGTVRIVKYPAVGRHFYSWNEWSTATGTTTWYGSIAGVGSTVQFGLTGWIKE